MAAALRINASSGPRSSPHERKRKSTDSHDGNNDKRNPSVMSDKYIHVHHYLDTGRWGTWFNDPTLKRGSGKRRLYFGTYETEYLAARAQDRAAIKFKPDAVRPITRLNFAESDYELDKDLRDKLTHEQFRRLLMAESRKCYKRAEPSPCWKIFLEEEAAKGNIYIEYMNRSNRYHRKPRTFTEVLQEIVSKNVAVDSEETTEPVDEPVPTGEEEGEVYTAKRIKRPTPAAPNQSAEEVTKELVAEDPAALPSRSLSARQVRNATKELVAEDPAALPTRSLNARQVRNATKELVAEDPAALPTRSLNARQVRNATKELVAEDPAALPTRSLSARQVRNATPEAAPPVRHHSRSASVSAWPVRKATHKAAPPVRRDAKSASPSAPQVRKATPNAAPPVRRDPKSASLSAPQVRKGTPMPKAAPPVLRRDTRNPSQSARPVPKGAPEAAPPVRREPSIFKQGVRRAEGEGRNALQTALQSSVYLDRLEWGRTRGRSTRNLNKLSLPNAASTEKATVAADSVNIMMMAANIVSEVTIGTPGTSDGKVALGSDHTRVENPSKRMRLNIDLNREPEPSTSTASAVATSHESDAIGGNDDPEVSSVETLLLLKSGWLK